MSYPVQHIGYVQNSLSFDADPSRSIQSTLTAGLQLVHNTKQHSTAPAHNCPVELDVSTSGAEVTYWANSDGWQWRKYGEKIIKSNPLPRSYYKCSQKGCNAKKVVQRDAQGMTFTTEYKGEHGHARPERVRYRVAPFRAQSEESNAVAESPCSGARSTPTQLLLTSESLDAVGSPGTTEETPDVLTSKRAATPGGTEINLTVDRSSHTCYDVFCEAPSPPATTRLNVLAAYAMAAKQELQDRPGRATDCHDFNIERQPSAARSLKAAGAGLEASISLTMMRTPDIDTRQLKRRRVEPVLLPSTAGWAESDAEDVYTGSLGGVQPSTGHAMISSQGLMCDAVASHQCSRRCCEPANELQPASIGQQYAAVTPPQVLQWRAVWPVGQVGSARGLDTTPEHQSPLAPQPVTMRCDMQSTPITQANNRQNSPRIPPAAATHQHQHLQQEPVASTAPAQAPADVSQPQSLAQGAASGTARHQRIIVDELVSDGYRWRKYGQKDLKGCAFPRSYYKCTTQGCSARKYVERLPDKAGQLSITYEGDHTHAVLAQPSTAFCAAVEASYTHLEQHGIRPSSPKADLQEDVAALRQAESESSSAAVGSFPHSVDTRVAGRLRSALSSLGLAKQLDVQALTALLHNGKAVQPLLSTLVGRHSDYSSQQREVQQQSLKLL